MANQGFVQNLNLSEVANGAQVLQNLAGGTIDADLRLFAGLSSERSKLFWEKFRDSVIKQESLAALQDGTKIKFNSLFTYTDDDYVLVNAINLLKDFAYKYVGFAADGVLSTPQSGIDITFDPGENYTPGVYTNVLLEGGSGTGARGTITVGVEGRITAVEVTNSGSNYQQGDQLEYAGIGSGVGFAITIVGNPYECVVVGNYAWDPKQLDTQNLTIEIVNTTPNLDGIYTIEKLSGGKNGWLQPNNSTSDSYEINAELSAFKIISSNVNLFDIDGDGVFTIDDVNLIYAYLNGATITQLNTIVTTANRGGSRSTGTRVYNYMTGLDPTLFDVDSNGTVDKVVDVALMTKYVSNTIYTRRAASTLINQSRVDASTVGDHVISVSFRVGKNPGYTIPVDLNALYEKPYFIVYKDSVNAFDNFSEYGTKQVISVLSEEYNARTVGQTFVHDGKNFIIYQKRVSGTTFYFDIVCDGTGFTNSNLPENYVNVESSRPVFSSTSEYGVFNSNSTNEFFLRTNPRSTLESIKELILFASKAPVVSGSYTSLPVGSILPDLVFLRDDSLSTSNIKNLEQPTVTDDGIGSDLGSFSYNVTNFNTSIGTVGDNVDESIYLRGSKYRTNANNYFDKDINVEGLITSYDPDQFNAFQTDLLKDNSPGIYIASSLAQITNTLAADFANKTRSFSSDYNPWQADTANLQLKTESLNVTIADLVFTTEYKFDIGSNSRYSGINLNQTLDDNFNATLRAQGKSFKLKAEINGEEYYIMMRKP
jgi:hypothetical protein